MLILSQAALPLSQQLFETYGLPGIVIAILIGIIWYQNRQYSKIAEANDARFRDSEKRSTEMEDRLIKQQEKIETELRGMLQSKSERIAFLESAFKTLSDNNEKANHRITTLQDALFENKTIQNNMAHQIKDLEVQLSKVISLNDDLALKNSSLIKSNQALMTSEKALKDQLVEYELLKKELSERDRCIQELQQQVNMLQKEVDGLREEANVRELTIVGLTTRVDKLDTQDITP